MNCLQIFKADRVQELQTEAPVQRVLTVAAAKGVPVAAAVQGGPVAAAVQGVPVAAAVQVGFTCANFLVAKFCRLHIFSEFFFAELLRLYVDTKHFVIFFF